MRSSRDGATDDEAEAWFTSIVGSNIDRIWNGSGSGRMGPLSFEYPSAFKSPDLMLPP